MSRYLSATELRARAAYSGHSHDDIAGMLIRYGFERTNSGDAKHMRFTHRDYRDLVRQLPKGKGELDSGCARDAIDICCEVKERNKKHSNDPHLEKIPKWVQPALPSPTCSMLKSDTVLECETGGPDTPVYCYEITYKAGKLTIHSIDDPELARSFTVRPGDRHIYEGFARVVKEFDAIVREPEHGLHEQYDQLLQRLRERRGFIVKPDEKEGIIVIHLHGRKPVSLIHPVHSLSLDLMLADKSDKVTQADVKQLEDFLAAHEACYAQQVEFEQALEAKGWLIDIRKPANSHSGGTMFIAPSGAYFEIPTYGEYNFYDLQMVTDAVATWEEQIPLENAAPPAEIVPQAEEEQEISTPTAGTALETPIPAQVVDETPSHSVLLGPAPKKHYRWAKGDSYWVVPIIPVTPESGEITNGNGEAKSQKETVTNGKAIVPNGHQLMPQPERYLTESDMLAAIGAAPNNKPSATTPFEQILGQSLIGQPIRPTSTITIGDKVIKLNNEDPFLKR
jgi:hypothetical protein